MVPMQWHFGFAGNEGGSEPYGSHPTGWQRRMRREEWRDRASWEEERTLSGMQLSLEVLMEFLAWAEDYRMQ